MNKTQITVTKASPRVYLWHSCFFNLSFRCKQSCFLTWVLCFWNWGIGSLKTQTPTCALNSVNANEHRITSTLMSMTRTITSLEVNSRVDTMVSCHLNRVVHTDVLLHCSVRNTPPSLKLTPVLGRNLMGKMANKFKGSQVACSLQSTGSHFAKTPKESYLHLDNRWKIPQVAMDLSEQKGD